MRVPACRGASPERRARLDRETGAARSAYGCRDLADGAGGPSFRPSFRGSRFAPRAPGRADRLRRGFGFSDPRARVAGADVSFRFSFFVPVKRFGGPRPDERTAPLDTPAIDAPRTRPVTSLVAYREPRPVSRPIIFTPHGKIIQRR